MKFFKWIVVSVAVFTARNSWGVTLDEYLKLAEVNSRSVKISSFQLEMMRSKLDQTAAPLYPQLRILGSYTRQDVASSPNLEANNKTARLNLSQSLMGLYKNEKALDLTKESIRSNEFLVADTLLQFRLSILESYYAVLLAESDLQSYEDARNLAKLRAREISSRVKIGRSKVSDLHTANAQLSSAEAQTQQAEAAVRLARLNLASLSGVDVGIKLEDTRVLPPSLDSVEKYQNQAAALPALKSFDAQVKAAEMQSEIYRKQRLPDVDLGANYYLYRDAPNKDVKWDVTLTVSWQIYDGGLISSRVKESLEQLSVVQEQKEEKKRTSLLKIGQAYDQASGSLKQMKYLKESVELSQKSFDAIDRDYKLGLATILEQVQATNAVTDAKRALSRQVLSAKQNLAVLSIFEGASHL